jgi:tryptophan synthase alpha chain
MNLKNRFEQLKLSNEKAFIPFLTIGDPTPEIFIKLVKEIEPYADVIELGIPFSDPIADGPVIMEANKRAQQSGVGLSTSYDLIKEIRSFSDKPIVLLTYANILGVNEERRPTLEKFAKSGVNGIIAADIPIEECTEILKEMTELEMDLIFLATPTTRKSRLEKIVEKASGFIYLVSVKGTTGTREKILNETEQTVTRIVKDLQNLKEIPVCVGFGISKPEHVKNIIKLGADGVIVGSALIKIIGNNLSNQAKMLKEVKIFVETMKNATKQGNN